MTDLTTYTDIPNLAKFDTSHIDSTRAPVVLVDGSYYLFRCFFALPPLSNKDGLPTNAIRGVLNALNKLMRRYKPAYMAVAFDTKAPTFRHELSDSYKAHRPPMDDDLRVQIPYIHRMIELLGIPLIKLDGFEADDIIGTLAHQACQAGHPVIISTGDKDMAQLVNDCVTLEDSFTGKLTDPAQVIDKFGVTTTQIADYLTLMGDASDGIAGIPKVGAKTAAKLLTEYQDIDGILANLDNIKGVVGKNLAEHRDEIPLNRTLATIVTNLRLPFEFDDIKLQGDDDPSRLHELHRLFGELEFRTEISAISDKLAKLETAFHTDDESVDAAAAKIDAELEAQFTQAFQEIDALGDDSTDAMSVPTLPSQPVTYQTISTMDQLDELLAKLHSVPYFAIDTETTSINWQHAELVGISIAYQNFDAYYIPVGHVDDLGVLLFKIKAAAETQPRLHDFRLARGGCDANLLGIVHVEIFDVVADFAGRREQKRADFAFHAAFIDLRFLYSFLPKAP